MILYTLYKNSYIDIAHLESTKGITCYVNSTNRCTCSCTFCLRQTKEMIENNSLWLKKEPTVEEIKAEFDKYDLNDFKEVVFCGFGEPLMRHDDLMQVAKYLRLAISSFFSSSTPSFSASQSFIWAFNSARSGSY